MKAAKRKAMLDKELHMKRLPDSRPYPTSAQCSPLLKMSTKILVKVRLTINYKTY